MSKLNSQLQVKTTCAGVTQSTVLPVTLHCTVRDYQKLTNLTEDMFIRTKLSNQNHAFTMCIELSLMSHILGV